MAVPVPVKFGPWGAGGGTPCDINKISCPEYLVSVSIWSNETPGGCINGLSFTYVDQINEPISVGIGGCQEPWSVANILFPKKVITAGTWSTHCYRGGVKTMKLRRDDRLTHVSGTADERGVTSLMLISDRMKIGPCGWPAGQEFSLPLDFYAGSVVAFFGKFMCNLKSLGVYVLAETFIKGPLLFGGPKGMQLNVPKLRNIKVGPWGPSIRSSSYWGPKMFFATPDEQLQSITIHSSERSGGRIYGFAYTCLDQDGESVSVDSCEQKSCTKGQKHVFIMNKDNYIIFIGGTHDQYGITSLKLFSTQDVVYGPFGCSIGTTFNALLQENAAFVSFFGHSDVHGLTNFGAKVMPQDLDEN